VETADKLKERALRFLSRTVGGDMQVTQNGLHISDLLVAFTMEGEEKPFEVLHTHSSNIYSLNDGANVFRCPNCGQYTIKENSNNCDHCGQKIKWEKPL